jgi:hypothetical protein
MGERERERSGGRGKARSFISVVKEGKGGSGVGAAAFAIDGRIYVSAGPTKLIHQRRGGIPAFLPFFLVDAMTRRA